MPNSKPSSVSERCSWLNSPYLRNPKQSTRANRKWCLQIAISELYGFSEKIWKGHCPLWLPLRAIKCPCEVLPLEPCASRYGRHACCYEYILYLWHNIVIWRMTKKNSHYQIYAQDMVEAWLTLDKRAITFGK